MHDALMARAEERWEAEVAARRARDEPRLLPTAGS